MNKQLLCSTAARFQEVRDRYHAYNAPSAPKGGWEPAVDDPTVPVAISRSFCATAEVPGTGNGEELRTPANLARWLVRAGLTDHSCEVTNWMLSQSWALREAIRQLCVAASNGDVLHEADQGLLNRHARDPRVRWQVTADWRRELQIGPDPVGAALATIAVDAIGLLAGAQSCTIDRQVSAPADETASGADSSDQPRLADVVRLSAHRPCPR